MRPSTAILLLAAALAPDARAEAWRAAPPDGRIVVHVFRKGALSAFAHDHHFEVTRWRTTADVPERGDPSASVQVILSAASLRDRQQSLSEQDRRKVDAQAAGPEVLDSARHPTIEFRAERFDVAPGGDPEHVRGTLHGTLSARGRNVPLAVDVRAARLGGEWRVRGTARVKQTELGIEPFSGFAGTVGVKDEVEIEAALILRRP